METLLDRPREDALVVASLNLKDGLNNEAVYGRVLAEGADVFVGPEGLRDDEEIASATKQAFDDRGYHLAVVPYGDEREGKDGHKLAVAVKKDRLRGKPRVIDMLGRAALVVTLEDGTEEGTVVVAAHPTDLDEATRLDQIEALLGANELKYKPRIILAGDLNGTHRRGVVPFMLRSTLSVTRRWKKIAPTREAVGKFSPGRFRSLAQRLAEMAIGTTVAKAEAKGLTDAARRRRATKRFVRWLPLGVQIDHIMSKGMRVRTPTTVKRMRGLSDHDLIRAEFEFGSAAGRTAAAAEA